MKQILAIFAILFIILLGIFFTSNNPSFRLNLFGTQPNVKINNVTFTVLLAKTEIEKETGLSHRPSLPANQGMLFIYDRPAILQYWMRDMKFPLDIIFIQGNKVVTLYQNVQPPTQANANNLIIYSSLVPSDKVLEINAGLAKKYNINVNDSLTISL